MTGSEIDFRTESQKCAIWLGSASEQVAKKLLYCSAVSYESRFTRSGR